MRDVPELARAAYGDDAIEYGDGTEGPYKSGRLALDAGKAKDKKKTASQRSFS